MGRESCRSPAAYGACCGRLPAVFGRGALVPRFSRPRSDADREWPCSRPTPRAREQSRVRPHLGRDAAQSPTRVRRGAAASRGGDRDRGQASHVGVVRALKCMSGLCSGRPRPGGGGACPDLDWSGRLARDRSSLARFPVVRFSPKSISRRANSPKRWPSLTGQLRLPRKSTTRRSWRGSEGWQRRRPAVQPKLRTVSAGDRHCS
jgi:hypothetical protein